MNTIEEQTTDLDVRVNNFMNGLDREGKPIVDVRELEVTFERLTNAVRYNKPFQESQQIIRGQLEPQYLVLLRKIAVVREA